MLIAFLYLSIAIVKPYSDFFFSYSVVFKSHNIAHNSLFLGSIYAKFVNSLKCFNTPFFFANILLATSVAILLPK